ncbi:VOC family protein [Andreprevotia chitinilytica]|uniref:VOC family protein n=1 Tax=Andreprevotia chitinilytica TaxID=396808 RepID=UPI0005513B92|nr:VOC family protein [Andreprevotia chitinilytica]
MFEKEKSHGKTQFKKIDHIAFAVKDLDAAIDYFVNVLGFDLIRRRVIAGQRTGMVSAEIEQNGIKFVLCQGTEPESQVSRLIENFGPGVAHIALAVDDVEETARQLSDQGMEFDTTVINGAGLKQVFSSRDSNTGLSFEFIERSGEQGFLEENVTELFAQLEKSGAY